MTPDERRLRRIRKRLDARYKRYLKLHDFKETPEGYIVPKEITKTRMADFAQYRIVKKNKTQEANSNV